jgi:arginine/lysine/ornithine decarboxylase
LGLSAEALTPHLFAVLLQPGTASAAVQVPKAFKKSGRFICFAQPSHKSAYKALIISQKPQFAKSFA